MHFLISENLCIFLKQALLYNLITDNSEALNQLLKSVFWLAVRV
jgi:hypothetical protein